MSIFEDAVNIQALQKKLDHVKVAYAYLDAENRHQVKRNLKLQQQLNRINNLMIGNERIWVLDRLAMECEVEAHMIDVGDIWSGRTSPDQARADALFIRRLEWDLGELHVAVKGDTARRGGRYDQSEWRGERP